MKRKLLLTVLTRKFEGAENVLCSERCPFLQREKAYCIGFDRLLFANYIAHNFNRCDSCLTYMKVGE